MLNNANFLLHYSLRFDIDLFKRQETAPKPESILTTTTTTQTDGTVIETSVPIVSFREPIKAFPLWAPNTKADVFVYVSEDYDFARYDDQESLLWRANDIEVGKNWQDERVADLSIVPSKHVQNNGTLYAHIYLAKQPATLNPSSEGFDPNNRVYVRKRKFSIRAIESGANICLMDTYFFFFLKKL